MSLPPSGNVGADWITEAFEDHFAHVFEQQSFADAEVGNCIRYQNLFRLRMSAETGGQLNCRSEEIVMLLDRFACCGSNSNLERALGIRLRVLVQFALNLNCAAHRARCRDE